ncbi:hypothetical protein EUGRSUZ_C01677 [Eucalyptus grandis]|uniref:Uncharacterized protein n=2 Tax=Eucalyptus grandis TaxID=71139 RepID=A0ACC3LDU1_EUCGR|nr:hypothetical protein EUGRSUZ_C01677 [Eucalyptus grandis]
MLSDQLCHSWTTCSDEEIATRGKMQLPIPRNPYHLYKQFNGNINLLMNHPTTLLYVKTLHDILLVKFWKR